MITEDEQDRECMAWKKKRQGEEIDREAVEMWRQGREGTHGAKWHK